MRSWYQWGWACWCGRVVADPSCGCGTVRVEGLIKRGKMKQHQETKVASVVVFLSWLAWLVRPGSSGKSRTDANGSVARKWRCTTKAAASSNGGSRQTLQDAALSLFSVFVRIKASACCFEHSLIVVSVGTVFFEGLGETDVRPGGAVAKRSTNSSQQGSYEVRVDALPTLTKTLSDVRMQPYCHTVTIHLCNH